MPPARPAPTPVRDRVSGEERPPRWLLPGAFAGALLFRLVGLGGSSMWLDEIVETLLARGDLGRLFDGLLYDRAQPPLEQLLSWGLVHAGCGELARRLVNTLLGAAAVALFARWAARRFGAATGAVTAVLLASSPVLVRYSHELRPYALWLLLSVAALAAADRWIARGGESFPAGLVVCAAAAGVTHYFGLVLWLPVAAAWLEGRLDGSVRRAFGRMHVAAAALSAAPLALWLVLLARNGGPRQYAEAMEWSFEAIETRFEDLLFRGYFWQPVVAHATLLFAVLAGVGFVVAARSRSLRGGPTLFAGLIAGTLPVEFALAAAGRFSHFRYDLFGLLFLELAIAVGIVAFARTVERWNRASGVVTLALLVAAVLATAANGVVGYAQHGRPDWPAVARAIERLEGPAARPISASEWPQVSLGYYLGRYDGWPQEPLGMVRIDNDRTRLMAELSSDPGRCRLVAVAAHPRESELFTDLRPAAPIFSQAESDELELYRFAPPGLPEEACLPPPGFAVVPSPGYGRLLPWLHRRGLRDPAPPAAVSGTTFAP